MRLFLTATITAAAFSGVAHAASVDLTGWVENGFQGNDGAGTWAVQGDNDEVFQSANGQPTVFFDPTSSAQGTQLSGTIEVETTGDDDYIGFVLGYQDGEFNSTDADFWLVDWKQIDQPFYGNVGTAGDAGLRLSHITGDLTEASASDIWNHVAVASLEDTATNLGSTGWNDNQLYNFDLTFTDNLIEVFVDGELELSLTGTFTDGAFGFYNYSQSSVRYAGITQDVLPPDNGGGPNVIPLPAGLPLLLGGLGALGIFRGRKKAKRSV